MRYCDLNWTSKGCFSETEQGIKELKIVLRNKGERTELYNLIWQ